MAEFRLERFKYNWRGEWQTGISYRRDDIVRVGGKSYVCIITHVSSPAFRTDLDAILPGSVPPQPEPKWILMTSSLTFIGDWSPATDYNLGDLVLYNGSLWSCTTNHQSTGFTVDRDNWTAFSLTTSFVGEWLAETDYAENAVVKYNGILYKCKLAHTSTTVLQPIPDGSTVYWEEYYDGVQWRGDFVSTEYRINDLVSYGGSIFRCIETHTSSVALDSTKFEVEVFGTQYDGTWDATVYYSVGDIVRHDGYVYYAVQNNSNSKPYLEVDGGSVDWIVLAKGLNFRGVYDLYGTYRTGDVVQRGGQLYVALRDIGEEFGYDGSSVDYLENDTWELIIPGKSWKGNWNIGNIYSVGDVIYWKGSAWTCNFEHEATISNFPGDNGSGYYFWDMLVQAGQEGGLKSKGDILTYGLSRQIDNDGSTVFDDSTLGDVGLPIGEKEQLLSITNDLEVYWRNIVEDSDSIFVATNGIDDDNRGTFQKPFRTVRHAAEYVADNYAPGTPVIIRVSAGVFDEIAPIIIPAGCAVNGDELRSTTIRANSPLPLYQNDYQYVQDYLTYLTSVMFSLVTGEEITPSPGNTETQILSDGEVFDPELSQDPDASFVFPISDLTGVNAVVNLFDDYRNFIEFSAFNGDIEVIESGSNIENTDTLIKNAGDALYVNRKFIKQEVYAYLVNKYPNVSFNEYKVKEDVFTLLRGVRQDLAYSGNHRTIIAAKRYANAVKGSQLENLFLLRDSTGLRDCTTAGLQGTLNPPGVFDLYQKPTGGALCSLDPGWGPDDERTWIINRSPYIQGVTNTGTGCTGMKVDGALHNGGNVSMTANDFTQVLSDGIGAWITNNGRAELVSVFTYYCQIGYFAEDGGIIRSANGNNSYGKYGSIADGVDDTEIPQQVEAFNRNNEAIVQEAFAGGANDSLFIFEYLNAGEQYTSATASIVGAGANADVEYTDFRDGGIFEGRLLSPDGSSSSGGSGYIRRQGSAQETPDASNTIKLAQTDSTQFESEILGMRLWVTGGTGVGQYGYITSFDFATKEVTVSKESDDTAGWDHVIPGTPLVSAFDLTTRYRIEARVTVPSPAYSSIPGDLFTNRTYVSSDFGTITETYNGVTATGNVIWVDDNQVRVTVQEIVSDIQMKFTGEFSANPNVPFNIKGKTSGATATITAISANTGTLIEVDLESGGNGFTLGEELDIVLTSGSGNTFDGAPIPAQFQVIRRGRVYDVSITSGGAGYKEGDSISIPGTQLGGTTPENDLRIIVQTVTDDSTSSILTFTTEGSGRGGRFVALTNSEYARWSDTGDNWLEVTLPFTANWKKVVNGNDRFIAIASNEKRIARSFTGASWVEVALPVQDAWNDAVYGNGKFVIVGTDTDIVLSSSDGVNWTEGYIPNDAVGDSTIAQWSSITYGNGLYVATSANDRATATSTDGVNWTRHDLALPDFGGDTALKVEYGNGRFIFATVEGRTAMSFDGETWSLAGEITDFNNPNFELNDLSYDNGIFVAVGTNGGAEGDVIATSDYGMLWAFNNLPSQQLWATVVYGLGKWVSIANAASTGGLAINTMGAKALLRPSIGTGNVEHLRVLNPGSGYSSANLPTITVTDPNAVVEIAPQARIGDGVLSQPDFVNRGAGYRSSTSTITITGDGFADIIPILDKLVISGVVSLPGPGVQIEIEGIEDPDALIPGTLAVFSGVTVKDLGDDGTGQDTKLVEFQISPRLEVQYEVLHGASITLREKFSQCRVSGHDFLDIGTGNFTQTNYPEIYAGGAFFTAAPENEVYEANGGRVFYVSTDQDGNFRTGELFSVQQATGIVTISAQFFDLDGLSELALGGVRLGGSGTVVNEFSTDPTFSADSNNVVPTQRAIATFLADRLSVGGESLEVNALQAGRIFLGSDITEISNASGEYIIIPSDVVFDGTFEANDGEGTITTTPTSISGTIVSQMLFVKEFDESMQ